MLMKFVTKVTKGAVKGGLVFAKELGNAIKEGHEDAKEAIAKTEREAKELEEFRKWKSESVKNKIDSLS